jgi:hypothetical protein
MSAASCVEPITVWLPTGAAPHSQPGAGQSGMQALGLRAPAAAAPNAISCHPAPLAPI